MLFLSESASYYGFEEGVTVTDALIEQMEAAQAVSDMEVALLEADYLFHTQVLTEEEQANPNSASGGEKKASFLQRVVQVIKNVIEKIKAAVLKVWNAIKGVFKKKVTEKEAEAEEVAKKEGVSKSDLYTETHKGYPAAAKAIFDTIGKYIGKVESVSTLDAAKALKTELTHALEEKEKELKKIKLGKKIKIPYAESEEMMKIGINLEGQLKSLLALLEHKKEQMKDHENRIEAMKKKEKPSAEEIGEYSRELAVVKQQLALAQRLNAAINHLFAIAHESLNAKFTSKSKSTVVIKH